LVVDYGDPSFARDKGLARRISSFVETISVNRADALISSDPLISAFIVRRWNRQARFLPNGYDERLFAPVAPKSPSAHKTITFVGKIDTSVYRLDILLKAFRLVIDELPSARLRLIGSGPDTEKLRRLALKLKLEGAVNFIGLVAHSDVPTWIRQSDVCVHMTNDTCMGLKVVEYMASAKPVVMAAPWWDKYDSFVENERNCLTVPPQPRALSAAILRILRNPMLAARLGRNARRTVQQYSWHNIAAALVQLTEGL
jgi:glycosyltransferase involved in cell wall biosynthesis